jgi:hypothetical protein
MTVRNLAGLALVFCWLPVLAAQPAKPPGDDKKTSKDEKKEAPKPPAPAPFKEGRLGDDNDKPSPQEQNEIQKLLLGSEDAPTGDRRKTILDKGCRWFIYRLTWPDIQEGRDGSISQLMEEVLGGPNNIPRGRLVFSISKQPNPDGEERARRTRQWAAVEVVRPLAIGHVEKVMELNPPIARINALRILDRLAELSFDGKANEEVADVFIRTIENPHEHDAVRVWAFHGLASLFNSINNPPDGVAIKIKDPKRFDRALIAVCTWLDARSKMDAGLVSQMSEPEKNAISFVRRGAIRALANARRPLVKDEKNAREGPVAQLLVKLIATEDAQLASPAPTWGEGVEAVLALCKLQSKLSPSYQPDYAAHQIAKFIAALGSQANDDVTRENPNWRSFGWQLRAVTDAWATEAPPERGGNYVKTAKDQINNALENLMDPAKNRQAAQELFNWANANAPKATAVYNPPLP